MTNGLFGPTHGASAWLGEMTDAVPKLTPRWSSLRRIARVIPRFGIDSDPPVESVQWNRPENAPRICVKHYRLFDAAGRVTAERSDNHVTIDDVVFPEVVRTDGLTVELLAAHGQVPPSLFGLRCYRQ